MLLGAFSLNPLGLISQHDINIHDYANDTQLYLSMEPHETWKLTGQQTCLTDIKAWKTAEFLLLTSDKTETVVFGPERVRNRPSGYLVTLDDITLAKIILELFLTTT